MRKAALIGENSKSINAVSPARACSSDLWTIQICCYYVGSRLLRILAWSDFAHPLQLIMLLGLSSTFVAVQNNKLVLRQPCLAIWCTSVTISSVSLNSQIVVQTEFRSARNYDRFV